MATPPAPPPTDWRSLDPHSDAYTLGTLKAMEQAVDDFLAKALQTAREIRDDEKNSNKATLVAAEKAVWIVGMMGQAKKMRHSFYDTNAQSSTPAITCGLSVLPQ